MKLWLFASSQRFERSFDAFGIPTRRIFLRPLHRGFHARNERFVANTTGYLETIREKQHRIVFARSVRSDSLSRKTRLESRLIDQHPKTRRAKSKSANDFLKAYRFLGCRRDYVSTRLAARRGASRTSSPIARRSPTRSGAPGMFGDHGSLSFRSGAGRSLPQSRFRRASGCGAGTSQTIRQTRRSLSLLGARPRVSGRTNTRRCKRNRRAGSGESGHCGRGTSGDADSIHVGKQLCRAQSAASNRSHCEFKSFRSACLQRIETRVVPSRMHADAVAHHQIGTRAAMKKRFSLPMAILGLVAYSGLLSQLMILQHLARKAKPTNQALCRRSSNPHFPWCPAR